MRNYGDDRYPFRYALFLAAYYVVNAAYQGFITLYFQDINISTEMIGALMATVPLVSIFSQPLWGAVGDKSKNRTNLLRVLIVASAALILAFYVSNSFFYLLVAIGLFAGFYIAIQPMGDSILLEALGSARRPFGPIRLLGCVSFGVASYIAGRLFEGRLNLVPAVVSALLMFAFAGTFALPNIEGHDQKREKTSIRVLFKQKELVMLLIFLTLLQMTMGFFYAFFAVHFKSLPGGSTELIGLCYLISAFSEIPFLIFSDKLIDRLGAGKLMCVSALVMTVRWVILGFVTSVPVIMASQVLHGWGFIVMTVSMSKYMNENVPNELKARAQILLGVIGFGVSRTIGTFAGGLLTGAIGFQNAFLVNGVLSFLTFVLFAPRFLIVVRKKEGIG